MTITQLKELSKHAIKRTAPTDYSVESVNQAVCDGFKELAGSINDFLKNQYDIFNIIIENADEVVPNKVISAIGAFANVKTVKQGEKVMFRRALGKNRAKKFLTQVGLSGVYETARLDSETYTVNVKSVGGAITADFERLLDGAETLTDLMDVITEGLTDAVFVEVQKALVAAINAGARPTANKYSTDGFDAASMLKLISVVKAYGGNAIIFATQEFIAEMGADAIVPITTEGGQGIYHPQDIDAIHNTGYINLFRGTPIIQIPQSFIDESNEKTWINPRFAYVLPAGKEKVVDVVLEGATQMWSATNKDQSIEVNAYKKMGCGIVTHHNWGIYENKDITDTSYQPYGY